MFTTEAFTFSTRLATSVPVTAEVVVVVDTSGGAVASGPLQPVSANGNDRAASSPRSARRGDREKWVTSFTPTQTSDAEISSRSRLPGSYSYRRPSTGLSREAANAG